MTWTERRFARNGPVELAHDRLQEGTDGEPLLLVMGLAVSRHWWPGKLCAAFADAGFAVARYDQRDAGESTRLPKPAARGNPFAALAAGRGAAYTAEDMADDAVAVMDALGWESAHLFGHSLGGVVAQRVALRHPDRVRTLTSSAALPSDVGGLGAFRHLRLPTLAKFARLKPAGDREGRIAAGLAVARLCASPGYPFDEAEALERITADVDTGIADPDAQSRQIGARWSGPPLSELRAPTLVLHGTDDPLLKPSAGRATAAAIRDAHLVLQPGVGHDIPRERHAAVAAEVRALADRASVGAATVGRENRMPRGGTRHYGARMATLRKVQVTFDCAQPGRLARFWCEVLGYEVPPVPEGFATWDDYNSSLPPEDRDAWSACADPSGVGPRLYFQRVPEGKVVKNRVHLDVRAGTGLVGAERLATLEAERDRLVALGAVCERVMVADEENESCIVMQDIEGNEFCLD